MTQLRTTEVAAPSIDAIHVLSRVVSTLGRDDVAGAGVRGACDALGEALGGRMVRLVAHGAERSSLAERWPAGPECDLMVESMADARLADEQRALVATVASLLAVVLGQHARLMALEEEVGTRVAQLAEQRRFMERIIDTLPVGLYVIDRDYRIHAWNHKRELGLQGVQREDAIGRTIFEILHRQPAKMLKREFDDVFATGRLQQYHMESTATGDVRSYRITKIPMVLDGDRATHVITVGEDITEWKAALDRKAQSDKLAAVGQLAAGIMHEINNPLATIAACSETLALQHGAQEMLHIIDLEVQRCTRIVNGLLDFARPKPTTREPLDLNEVVEQGLFLVQHHPRMKRVRVVTEFVANTSLAIDGDADQLVQVLIALMLNALDASPDDARITLRTRRGALGGSAGRSDNTQPACVLEVVDEGHGVPRAVRDKVFEPFFTTKPPGQGTGLGLTICYGIITDHGGVLECDSVEGQGATFRVVIPVRSAAGSLTAHVEATT